MKGRNGKSRSGAEIAPSSMGRKTSNAVEVKPKKLQPVGGKKGQQRLDKPVRGRQDANAYKNGGGIHKEKREVFALNAKTKFKH